MGRMRPPCSASLLVLAFVSSAFLLSGCGQEDGLVATPATLDFGAVPYKDEPTMNLVLENHGRRTVFVSAVTPNCACFSVGTFLRTIEPGERRAVPVTFHSGRISPERLRGKVLTVMSDDAGSSNVLIHLEADPFLTHSVTPESIRIGRVDDAAKARSWKVSVRPGAGCQVHVARATVRPEKPWRVEVRPAEGGGEDAILTLDFAKDPAAGLFRAMLTLELELTLPGGGTRRVAENVPLEGSWLP